MPIVLLLSFACFVPCESVAAGEARDACFHQRVTLDTQRWSAAEVASFARQIDDPIIREATVMVWARDHRGLVAAADREALCGLLAGVERHACQRRLETAHLLR